MIKQDNNSNQASKRLWRSFAIILAVTVLVVNITFIIASEATNPGLVNEAYNEYGSKQYLIDVQYRQQLDRGWKIDLQIPDSMDNGRYYNITLRAMDKYNAALTGARAELACYRPSNINQDIFFEFTESTHTPGEYTSRIKLDSRGIWDINLLVKLDGKTHIEHRRIKVISTGSHSLPRKFSMLDTLVNFLTGNAM